MIEREIVLIDKKAQFYLTRLINLCEKKERFEWRYENLKVTLYWRDEELLELTQNELWFGLNRAIFGSWRMLSRMGYGADADRMINFFKR